MKQPASLLYFMAVSLRVSAGLTLRVKPRQSEMKQKEVSLT